MAAGPPGHHRKWVGQTLGFHIYSESCVQEGLPGRMASPTPWATLLSYEVGVMGHHRKVKHACMWSLSKANQITARKSSSAVKVSLGLESRVWIRAPPHTSVFLGKLLGVCKDHLSCCKRRVISASWGTRLEFWDSIRHWKCHLTQSGCCSKPSWFYCISFFFPLDLFLSRGSLVFLPFVSLRNCSWL